MKITKAIIVVNVDNSPQTHQVLLDKDQMNMLINLIPILFDGGEIKLIKEEVESIKIVSGTKKDYFFDEVHNRLTKLSDNI